MTTTAAWTAGLARQAGAVRRRTTGPLVSRPNPNPRPNPNQLTLCLRAGAGGGWSMAAAPLPGVPSAPAPAPSTPRVTVPRISSSLPRPAPAHPRLAHAPPPLHASHGWVCAFAVA